MPLELQIIRAAEFIRVGAQGKPNLAASRNVLRTLAAACLKRGIHRALLDIREVPIGPTLVFAPADLATLVNTFREMGFTRQQRLAVLYREDPHDRIKMFALIGTLKGWSVEAFTNFEDAFAWLALSKPAKSESAARTLESQIPVRSGKVMNKAGGKPAATRRLLR